MSPKLLIVDDESGSRDALRRAVRNDFEVIEASSAEDALKILGEIKDVAIVVSDEEMPGQKGIDFLGRVKLEFPSVVRVILSGKIDLEDMMRAVNGAHVHRFILKPWETDFLRLQLQEAVQISKLEQLAITDPVTGLTNHRYFQERIREETERSLRHGRIFSLIMIDVDHFKAFNDRYGHPEGDKALAQLAHLLKTATRSADTVSRYGGEEFAMVLPETDKSAAREVAERIRRDLENTALGNIKKPHMITLSLGVASFPDDGKTADQIINAADQALYYAKERGRNRVECYP